MIHVSPSYGDAVDLFAELECEFLCCCSGLQASLEQGFPEDFAQNGNAASPTELMNRFLKNPSVSCFRSSLAAAMALFFGGLAAAQQDAVPTFTRYNLRCLAPLLENLDTEAPKTLEEALLAGPSGSLGSRVDDGRIGVDGITFPIETNEPKAQQAFRRGIALLHTLWYDEAARAFRTVVHLEPDRAMGYWGLAMANELRPGRARVFAQAAVDRTNVNRPVLEQRWVKILGDFYGVYSSASSAAANDSSVRSRSRIRALEDLVVDHPESVEAKAFMLRQLVLDQYRSQVVVTSRLGVEQLVEELNRLAPNHPSAHYGAFLWLGERPDRGVAFGLRATQQAPGVADVWRYAAESLAGAGRSDEALAFYEAAIRADQNYLREYKLMPWESRNFAINYRRFIETLIGMGRINEALSWSQQMMRFPDEKVSNEAGDLQSMAEQGMELWIRALVESRQWDRLSEGLASGEPARMGDDFVSQTRVVYWRTVAAMFLDFEEKAPKRGAELKALYRQAISQGVSNQVEASLMTASDSLRKVQSLFTNGNSKLGAEELDDLWIPPTLLTAIYEKVGSIQEALRLAKVAEEAHPDHVLKVATSVALSFRMGQRREAFFRVDRRFRALADKADKGLPPLADLDSVTREMQLPVPWTLRLGPTPQAFVLDDLGPAIWQAPKVKRFALRDAHGKLRNLDEFAGKPLVLNFFLGVQCGFCLEQLGVFKPHLDAFREAGVEFVAVSSDPVEVLGERLQLKAGQEYAPDGEFPFLILGDPQLEVFRQFGSFDDFEDGPLHATVVLDGDGRLVWADRGHAPFKRPKALLSEIKRLLNLSASQKSEPREAE